MNIDQNARTFVCQILDDHYERTSEFTDDIVTSDRVLQLLRENWPNDEWPGIDLRLLHNLMQDFGYTGTSIPGSNEKLWKVKIQAKN